MGTAELGAPAELDAADVARVLERAYVPEHVVGLMASLSGGTPRLLDEHLLFVSGDVVIVVGYPLDDAFSVSRAEAVLRSVRSRFRPAELRFVGPEVPPSLLREGHAHESDRYYVLDLEPEAIPVPLRRVAERARRRLDVERTRKLTAEHERLVEELRERTTLSPPVDRLYRSLPAYVAREPTACVLDARSAEGSLAAFFVVETAARRFDAYVAGGHSRHPYVPHASDLLFEALIRNAEERGKRTLNLGLGVNDGIRRFKQKWGGRPERAYEACTCLLRRPSPLALLRMLWGKTS